MSVLRTPQFSDYLGSSFIHVPRPTSSSSRLSSAGSFGQRPFTGGSLGSTYEIPEKNRERNRLALATPQHDYNYTRQQSYQERTKPPLQTKKSTTKPRKRRRRKKKKQSQQHPADPADPADPSNCYQWDDPDHPNKVVWGQRQRWLEASGESPGPITSVANTIYTSNVKSQPSVVIGGAKPKNDVDWLIYRASTIPSAQEYMLSDQWVNNESGGRFSTAKPKEYLDWVKYYAEQLPAPGDYELPDQQIKGGRMNGSKPKNDVEWSIYRAKSKPGPGAYSMDRSSMVVQNRVNKKGAVLLGKVKQGNNCTVVPNNFTLFKHTTSHPSGPARCRFDSSMGKQVKGDQTSAPCFSFGARTPAQSIYTESIYLEKLHHPPPKKNLKYKRNNMYNETRTLGYDPFVRRGEHSNSKSTSSLMKVPSRNVRHRGMGLEKLSKTFTKQYKIHHRLSKPKWGRKVLPTDGFGFDPTHFQAMARINRR